MGRGCGCCAATESSSQPSCSAVAQPPILYRKLLHCALLRSFAPMAGALPPNSGPHLTAHADESGLRAKPGATQRERAHGRDRDRRRKDHGLTVTAHGLRSRMCDSCLSIRIGGPYMYHNFRRAPQSSPCQSIAHGHGDGQRRRPRRWHIVVETRRGGPRRGGIRAARRSNGRHLTQQQVRAMQPSRGVHGSVVRSLSHAFARAGCQQPLTGLHACVFAGSRAKLSLPGRRGYGTSSL